MRTANRPSVLAAAFPRPTATSTSGPARFHSGNRSIRQASGQADVDGVDGVAAVAEPVPFGLVGLGASGEVGGAGPYGGGSGSVLAGEQFPPLPAVSGAGADELGWLPGPVADADLDVGDGRGACPGDAADGQAF